MIYSSLQRTGVEYDIEEAGEFQSVLDRTVERIEEFIYRNSDVTEKQLVEYKRKLTANDTCDAAAARYYSQIASIDAMRFNDNIDKLLEVDRPPVWNPCL